MNKVIILGRLTRDPEIKTIPSGKKVATFSLATSKKWKDQQGQQREKAEFHNIVVWEKLADVIARFGRKGNRILVEGELQTRTWDKEGIKQYRTEIIGNNLNIVDFPPKETTQQPNQQAPVQEKEEIKVDNIPF